MSPAFPDGRTIKTLNPSSSSRRGGTSSSSSSKVVAPAQQQTSTSFLKGGRGTQQQQQQQQRTQATSAAATGLSTESTNNTSSTTTTSGLLNYGSYANSFKKWTRKMSGITCGAGMGMSMGGGSTNDSPTESPEDLPVASPATQVLKTKHHNANAGNANDMMVSAAQQHAQMLQKSRSDDYLHKAGAFTTARTTSTEATSVIPSTSNSSTTSSIRSHGSHLTSHSHHHHPHQHPSARFQQQHQQHNHQQGIPVSRSNDSHSRSVSSSRSQYYPSNAGNVYKPGAHKHQHHLGSSNSYDHTYATASMTASATISYSTDEVEHVQSDISEAGMEVVMEDERASMLSFRSNGHKRPPQESPYKSHSFPAGKHTFTVDQRYSFIRVIGSGAYGVVISAKDNKTDTDVAVKMVPKAFHDEIDAKRILREIKLLKHFRHENIVSIMDMMPPSVQYVEDFHDVYMVTDLMETDLHRIIYSKQKLSMDHVQYFVYQVLRGLKYIHSCNVLHRDLKPSNLLVNSNCDLKICDFGLARGVYDNGGLEGPNGSLLLTEYVVTRWYRAPEIMLACHEYSKPIDVWSVGCIFAELIMRKPYFPGDDYIDQVCCLLC
mgnify:CR=1 FL=1